MVTIAGPVDTWRVDVTALFIDLVVWVALLILVPMFFREGGSSRGVSP